MVRLTAYSPSILPKRSASGGRAGEKAARGGKWLAEPKLTRLAFRRKLGDSKAQTASTYAQRKVVAIAINHISRMVKRISAPEGTYVDETGATYNLERLRFWRLCKPAAYMWDHHCTVAVTLLLRVLLESMVVCVLLGLVSLPLLLDNVKRTSARVQCRRWWQFNASCALFNDDVNPECPPELQNPGETFLPPDSELTSDCPCGFTCGRDGNSPGVPLPLRRVDMPPDISLVLYPAIGSCEEYTNDTTILIPPPLLSDEQRAVGVRNGLSDGFPFIDVPLAPFCIEASSRRAAEWVGSLGSTIVVRTMAAVGPSNGRALTRLDWAGLDVAPECTWLGLAGLHTPRPSNSAAGLSPCPLSWLASRLLSCACVCCLRAAGAWLPAAPALCATQADVAARPGSAHRQ
jgi:hypothetical protein